jgi:hypothetical protein
MFYVRGFCNDKKQLNVIKGQARRIADTVNPAFFVLPFSALQNAGCFCLTEYCIHRTGLSYF